MGDDAAMRRVRERDRVPRSELGRFDHELSVPFHFHEGAEVVFVHGGLCTVHVPDHAFEAEGRAGDCLLLPAGLLHDQVNARRTQTTYAVLKGLSPALVSKPRRLRAGIDSLPHRFIEDLLRLSVAPPEVRERAVRGVASALEAALLALRPVSEEHPAIARALRWIDAHLETSFSLSDLAEHVGLSTSRFHAVFRAEVGTSPLRYILDRRMERARALLRDDYLTIAEVGRRCGFSDVNYFVRTFHAKQGSTPGAYRRARRGARVG